MYARIVFCLLFSFTVSDTVYAISNIESRRPVPPGEGISGGIELSANGKSGNVEEDRYGAAARLVFKHQQETFFSLFSKSRSTARNQETADQAFAHLRWIHQQNDRFATEGYLQWQEDEFSSLLSRYLAGAGGRYQWLDRPGLFSLTSGAGFFREWERTDLGTFTEDKSVWRMNLYTVYKQQLNPVVNWYGTAYVQRRGRLPDSSGGRSAGQPKRGLPAQAFL